MAEDAHAALRQLAGAVRALLEEEAELGGVGVPACEAPVAVPAQRAQEEASPPVGAVPVTAPSARVPEPAPATPADPAALDKRARLGQLAAEAAQCRACVLHEKRTRSVFARGSDTAELAFVGEGPGYDEDQQGYPFVGAAGKLLDRMVAAMGFARDEVYVCNVVKCRPPENRTPRPEEASACSRFLVPQLELVAPKVIVALGRCAAENLGLAGPTGPWRGRWGTWHGVQVLPTYHPAYLLRSPEQKRVVWDDLQQVMKHLGRTPPPRRA